MSYFGYIINPKETALYNLNGSVSKIKMHIPLVKDDVIKISDIYNKDNEYIGDVISIPQDKESSVITELLLKYIYKNKLDFVCLGDALRLKDYRDINHERIYSGIIGIKYAILMYIKEYLNKEICNAEIIIGIEEYDQVTVELIKFFSKIGNYITITGYNIGLDETLLDEIYVENGLSVNYCASYTKLSLEADIFINMSRYINPKLMKFKMGEGLVIDPFFLINKGIPDEVYIINKFGLSCDDIVFFNKLNIINNIYSPQLIESIVRGKYPDLNNNIDILVKEEIEKGQYKVIY